MRVPSSADRPGGLLSRSILCGGDKQGKDQRFFYKRLIAKADARFDDWLKDHLDTSRLRRRLGAELSSLRKELALSRQTEAAAASMTCPSFTFSTVRWMTRRSCLPTTDTKDR